ncbi:MULTISPECIES: flagellar biosynthesis regulator FlaF [Microbaculum]|uniref:Flagellar biosynthesis regulator FlaF n=1 Tax=Microbaculum marinisediminis TaxID=2931392 RepID=A0AAW5R2H3_9HYPH|nr:flagellar biosynthesis regulator FlaF [Microbaculum sp. A6E488]MCT8972814.1 flagellar biosynthesis regulator FlaF [Microbaculum sp. A6E488]
MQNSAAQLYASTAQKTSSPRDLEADLLIKAAAKLQRVCDDWPNRKPELDEALTFNRRLWTIFATSATKPENPLPHQVKQNIANLSLFIFNQTIDLQTNPRPEKVPSLISINRELAAGLRATS